MSVCVCVFYCRATAEIDTINYAKIEQSEQVKGHTAGATDDTAHDMTWKRSQRDDWRRNQTRTPHARIAKAMVIYVQICEQTRVRHNQCHLAVHK